MSFSFGDNNINQFKAQGAYKDGGGMGGGGMYMKQKKKRKENIDEDILVFSENEKSFKQTSCIIRNGKLILPDSSSCMCKEDEYECCVLCVDSDIKDVVFELYMNIVTRLRK